MIEAYNTSSDTLQSLVEILNTKHFDLINTLCCKAKEQAQQLQEQEAMQTSSQYVTLCNQLIGEIQNNLSVRKAHLLPYIHSLSEKEHDGHDCRNCTGTGSCSLQHDMQLMEINRSHQQLKDIIYRLQMAALPLYSGTFHLDLYKTLQNQMALLENSLTALLLLEETQLLPKITEAQLNINARS